MKYTSHFKIKWHDTDASRVVRTSRILMYLQETANLQCAEMGLPLDDLRDEKGVGFVLGSISADLIKPLHAYEEIDVRTWCRASHGYSFLRYYEILRNDEVVLRASSIWALIDVVNKTMVKGDESLDEHFPIDEPIDAELLPKKARVSKGSVLKEVGKRKIVYSDIDYNMHMNNTIYPDMICDFLPDMMGKRISKLSLSYIKEAAYGDELTVLLGRPDAEGFFEVRTLNSKEEVCLEARVKLEDI